MLLTILVEGVTACVQYPAHVFNYQSSSSTLYKHPSKYAYPYKRNYTLIASINRRMYKSQTSLASSHTNTSTDIWSQLRSDMQLPSYENKLQVQEQIQWYMKHQDYLYQIINRSSPYIYYVYQQVKQRNLPTELVLLPIIESEYNPFTTSSVGASGLWQLMPDTARGFGVRQDLGFDGRRDIHISTNAALDYLTYLQSYFGGDWLLATAAYDAGEGKIQNAIHRNAVQDKGTSFWSLSLPLETRYYVPRLLALASIIKNPEKYNIKLPSISGQPYLAQVNVDISIDRAAKLAGMTAKELKQLNPGYKNSTRFPKQSYLLLFPIERISAFEKRLAAIVHTKKVKNTEVRLASAKTELIVHEVNEKKVKFVSNFHKKNHIKKQRERNTKIKLVLR